MPHASAGPGAVLLASRPCQRSAPAALVPDGPVQRRFQGQSVIGVSASLRQRERGLGIRPPHLVGSAGFRMCQPGLRRGFPARRRFVGFASVWMRAERAALAAESVKFQRRGDPAVGRDSWGLPGPSASGQGRGLAWGGRARPACILSNLVQAFLSPE